MDEAGRRQYLYHPVWAERRSRRKFDQMLDFARALPDLRDRVSHDIRARSLTRDRVLATGVRLLDEGFFRIGSETYAEKNGTVGLATLRARHVEVASTRARFCYPGKHGIDRVEVITDRTALRVVKALMARPHSGDDTLLAYESDGQWARVRSQDINAYVKEASGLPAVSAKDFRTWSGTVIAACALAGLKDSLSNPRAIRSAQAEAVRVASEHLGNTPAVCRKAYVDPRVLDLFERGITVSPRHAPGSAAVVWSARAGHSPAERAVLRLLS